METECLTLGAVIQMNMLMYVFLNPSLRIPPGVDRHPPVKLS